MRRYVLLGKPALGIFGVLIGSLGGGVLFCLFALGLKFLFVFFLVQNGISYKRLCFENEVELRSYF